MDKLSHSASLIIGRFFQEAPSNLLQGPELLLQTHVNVRDLRKVFLPLIPTWINYKEGKDHRCPNILSNSLLKWNNFVYACLLEINYNSQHDAFCSVIILVWVMSLFITSTCEGIHVTFYSLYPSFEMKIF